MKLPAHNLDALNDDARALIACYFTLPTGWTDTYMVEVRLDNPMEHLLDNLAMLKHAEVLITATGHA